MAADVPALQARNLSKRYRRRRWALRGVDLEVSSGGITALVGPNAAGKSTLIRTWVGFESATSGTACVAGLDPWRERGAVLRRVGYVPQSPSLYGGLSVADHLRLAQLLRPNFDRQGAVQRLDALGIAIDSDARQLSGGQQAQVALALALGTNADILLLDEPLASLDPLARREFLHVLTEGVRERGATAILSSHIVTDVEQACDDLIVLGIGQVLLHAPIREAMAMHSVMPTGADGARSIASFRSAAGGLATLIRNDLGVVRPRDARPATLEEIVIGYLASVRPGAGRQAA